MDGLLTPEEQKLILEQFVTAPEAVKKLTTKAVNGVVSLSWQPVKEAVYYEIYRDGVVIATSTKTSYKDADVEMNNSYLYAVHACNYSKYGPSSNVSSVFVDIVYKSMSAKELNSNFDEYNYKYVKIGNLKKDSGTWSGDDLYLWAYNGSNYVCLFCEDYKSWSWDGVKTGVYEHSNVTSISVQGQVIGTRNGYPMIDVYYLHFNYRR